ncbi:hypothetical protein BDR03DRAFT_650781 [Suillus americanus]|nr:hypothetical protein BDR03DRAFT_650781 [Suillus americanus]
MDCSKSHLTIPNLLNALSLPDLRHSLPDLRQFIADTFCMQWPHEEFKAFLARSKCPLQFVSFGDAMTAPELDALQAEYIGTHSFS